MTVTILGPGGYPRPPYASFAGKTTSGVTALFTVSGRDVTQIFEPEHVISGPGVSYRQSAMSKRTH